MGWPVWGKGAHHDEAAAAVRAAQRAEPVDALECAMGDLTQLLCVLPALAAAH